MEVVLRINAPSKDRVNQRFSRLQAACEQICNFVQTEMFLGTENGAYLGASARHSGYNFYSLMIPMRVALV